MNWYIFLKSLENKQVVPILGNHLLQVDYRGTKTSLYEYITQELKVAFNETDPLHLRELLQKYQGQGAIDAVQAFYHEVKPHINKKPFEQLASIPEFDFFVSCTFDDLLEEQLNIASEAIINYSDTPEALSPNLAKDDRTVFKLLGGLSAIRGFASTEEELLEYLHSLNNENPSNAFLFNKIQGKTLVFIGCEFTNWLLKFTLRILSKERFLNQKLTKIIADDKTYLNTRLKDFLSTFNIQVLPVGEVSDSNYQNSMEFVDKLYKEYNINKAKKNELTIRYEGSVFLSFNSLDRDLVKQIKEALALEGVNVWYDEHELEAGADYNSRIKKEILKCTLFIPFISENSIADKERYVNRVEWKIATSRKIINEDDPFLMPFLLDDTEYQDSRIPDVFKEVTMERFAKINDLVSLVTAKLKKIL